MAIYSLKNDLILDFLGIALDVQLVDILLLANNYLPFVGSNGQVYRMSEAVNEMSAYFQMTDNVLDLVRTFFKFTKLV